MTFKKLILCMTVLALFSACSGKRRSSPAQTAAPPTSSSETSHLPPTTSIPPGKEGAQSEPDDLDQINVDPIAQDKAPTQTGDKAAKNASGKSTDKLPGIDSTKKSDAGIITSVVTQPKEIIAVDTKNSVDQITTEIPTDAPSDSVGTVLPIEVTNDIVLKPLLVISSNERNLELSEVKARLSQLLQSKRGGEEVLTGSSDVESQLPFSGSQNDQLLEIFKAKVAKGRNADSSKKWAQKIGSVQINDLGSSTEVKIFWKEGNKYSLDVASLSLNEGSQEQKGTSGKGNSVRLLCIDSSNACSVSVVEISNSDLSLVAYVLVRKSSGHIHLKGNAAVCSKNGPYQRLLSAMNNTSMVRNKQISPESVSYISQLSFRSFEVIYGSSSYDIELRLKRENNCDETLNLRGALLTGKTNAVVGRAVPLTQQVVFDSQGRVLQTDAILGKLNCVVLSKNDGRGNLEFDMQFAASQINENPENFKMMILRNPVELNIQSIQTLQSF